MKINVVAALVLFTLLCDPLQATERLMLVGGGKYPTEGISQFVSWAGGANANLLIISWATESPQGALERISASLAPFNPACIEPAPSFEAMAESKAVFLEQLHRASGVFFTGGDQNRIMQVLADSELISAVRNKAKSGVPFAGSSAGTAIMSRMMFTGGGDFTTIGASAVDLKPGLGLLPGVIVDTHFLKRQRENRLFSALEAVVEPIAIGIDQDAALAIEDGHLATVMGATKVMVVIRTQTAGQYEVRILNPSQSIDLRALSTHGLGQ